METECSGVGQTEVRHIFRNLHPAPASYTAVRISMGHVSYSQVSVTCFASRLYPLLLILF